MQLVRYEAARAALQAAHSVDEVKDLRDKAQAMAAYAKQANDTQLVEWATEIKVRAERRAGEMLADLPKHNGGNPNLSHDTTGSPKTLAELGISKDQSSRWQKLAAIPEDKFEQAVIAAKEVAHEVTTAALLRSAKTVDESSAKVAEKKQPAPKTSTPEPTVTLKQYQALEEKYQELTEELETLTVIDGGDVKAEMTKLRESLRQANRRRDELMVESAEKQNQIDYYKRELKKLGWKPSK